MTARVEPSERVGISVTCIICGREKVPHGRSSGCLDLCWPGCEGYHLEPKPGCLWPGERESEFGYHVCDNATRRVLVTPVEEEKP